MKKQLSNQFPLSLFKLRNKESLVLYLSMFVMGACGLAYEYTLSKVSSDILGNTARQWAIIIGVMMFFMGIGSDTQKYFKNKNLLDKFIAFEILLGLLGAFGPITLIYTYGKFPAHFVLAQYFLISAIGLVIGFEIPLITRINQTYIKELKINIGGVLKMDYIGSLTGALAWVFLLPKIMTIVESAFLLGLFNVGVGLFAFVFFYKMIKFKIHVTSFAAISLFLVLSGLLYSKSWSSHAEQYLFRDRIVYSKTTQYQHIVLTESPSGDINCYINGHIQFNSFDEYIYHENIVHPAYQCVEHLKKILILGGGDGLALREVLKYPGIQMVTLCDIDPEMTRLAKDNIYFKELNNNSLASSKLTILENNALIPAGKVKLAIENQNDFHNLGYNEVAEIRIINIDAAKFVEQISGVFDLIIIDFPDPNSPELAKLYSLQFYQHLKRKLSAYGIIVQQSTSPIHSKEVFLCIGRTMQKAGFTTVPFHDNVPSFGEWGWWIAAHSERMSAQTLQQKLLFVETIPVATRYLTPELINSSLHFGKDQLISENKQINTLLNNYVYELYLQAWKCK